MGEDAEGAPAPGEIGGEDDGFGIHKDPSFSRWRAEEGIELGDGTAPAPPPLAPLEADDFELPLLHGDGSPSELPQFGSFRQRGMHTGTEANGGGRRDADLDGENGMRTSESLAKLELMDQSTLSSVSAIVVLKTLFYVAVWYTFSTSLTLYNKTLLGDELGKFPAPLLMNTVHFSLQAILSKAILFFQSRGSDSSDDAMTWRDYFVRVLPTAIGTALDINLSNASLVFISVTFATMCKSASPIFLLLFAFAFRLESPSFKLLGIISVISIGILLTVAKETEFNFWGFIFVMLASVMSGFRWCMTQILLQKDSYGLKNPITLMSYVTPVMAVATAIMSLLMDPWDKFETNKYFDNSWHIIRSCLLMLIGGSLAFFMVLTEYILISATSAVTVTIAGVVKEAVTILVAVFYFHDHFTLLKGVGLLTIMVGVGFFNWYKYEKLKKGQLSGHDDLAPPGDDGTAKYVIFDGVDLEEVGGT